MDAILWSVRWGLWLGLALLGVGCTASVVDASGDETTTSTDGEPGRPLTRCGDGVVQGSEECDDGNAVPDDDCTNTCTAPVCGDGIVQAGEDCDDGDNELNDDCPPDCYAGCLTPGCDDPPPCDKPSQPTYVGMVDGAEIPWSSSNLLGIDAGQNMCAAIGADHVCTYREILEADQLGELVDLPIGTTFWVHRLFTTVMAPDPSDPGQLVSSPPGPGGRCNEWTANTETIVDGEYGVVGVSGTPAPGGIEIGSLTFFFDADTVFTADPTDGHQGTGPGAGGPCKNVPRAILCCGPCSDP